MKKIIIQEALNGWQVNIDGDELVFIEKEKMLLSLNIAIGTPRFTSGEYFKDLMHRIRMSSIDDEFGLDIKVAYEEPKKERTAEEESDFQHSEQMRKRLEKALKKE